MDPSDEQHDDDLFADLYGDDEPPKKTIEAPQEPPVEATNVTPREPVAPVAPVTVPEQVIQHVQHVIQSSSKAVDPREPQPPSEVQISPETPTEEQYINQTNPYNGWDAANMGQASNMNENQGYDIGSGNYGDQGTGSPAIKEDGKMFIGGLNWETTDDSLKEYFSQFGEVTECTVMRDGPTGRSRGFGFLTFKDPKTVNIVMVKEHYLDGKIIDPKRAIPRDEQEKTSKIFVGGVSQEATESDFREFFTQFGRVLDATLMMDKDTGRPRGFGFVTFDSEAAVENALSCQTLEIMGKQIEVKKAQPRGSTRGAHEERDERGGFRDRGNRERFENRDSNAGYNNAPQGQNIQTQSATYNGLTPQMMAQYWQSMQRYMQAMSQFGRGAGASMPIINPAMMQQAMQSLPQMVGMNPQLLQQMNMQAQAQILRQQQAGQQSPHQSPPAQMAAQMSGGNHNYGGGGVQGGGAQGGGGGYGGGQQNPHCGFDGQGGYGDMQAQAQSQQQQQQQGPVQNHYRQQQQQQSQARFQHHPSQRDYQPPQAQPSSWEGMYDDVPPQQIVQQMHQNAQRQGTPNGQQQYGRFEGPPPNAPTGPRNTKPGSNYRGGRSSSSGSGRGAGFSGARAGYHPYARSQDRF